jgi:hypothetical protein
MSDQPMPPSPAVPLGAGASRVALAALAWSITAGACGDAARSSADGATSLVDAQGPSTDDDARAPLLDAGPLSDAGTATRLLDHTAWRTYDASLDPLASHQPPDASCGLGGYFADPVYHSLDVETAYCNYTRLEHPAQAAVAQGDTLRLRFYHFDLVATERAEAHVALLLDDTLAWDTTIPIPSMANAFDVTFEAPRSLAVGEAIRWHLHNHGQNSWVLTSLTREP